MIDGGKTMAIKNLILSILLIGLVTLLFFAACESENSDDDDDDTADPGIGKNPQLSDCGGFAADKSKADDDEMAECGDEMLNWSYDSGSGTVVFVHKDVFLNCCGNHSIAVYFNEDENVYEITETDSPEMYEGEAARCGCMCLFDFGVEVADLEESAINVKLSIDVTDDDQWSGVHWKGQIDLSETTGEILIEENVGWCE